MDADAFVEVKQSDAAEPTRAEVLGAIRNLLGPQIIEDMRKDLWCIPHAIEDMALSGTWADSTNLRRIVRTPASEFQRLSDKFTPEIAGELKAVANKELNRRRRQMGLEDLDLEEPQASNEVKDPGTPEVKDPPACEKAVATELVDRFQCLVERIAEYKMAIANLQNTVRRKDAIIVLQKERIQALCPAENRFHTDRQVLRVLQRALSGERL